MNPRFGADLVAVLGCFFEDLGIVLHGDSRGKETRADFFRFKDFKHAVNPDPFAKFAIRDDRQIPFGFSIAREAAPIFLLQCIGTAQVHRPGLEGNAGRDRYARAIGPLDRFPFGFNFHLASSHG